MEVIARCHVPLSIGKYIDEVLCDVVDINSCRLFLSRLWQYDVDAIIVDMTIFIDLWWMAKILLYDYWKPVHNLGLINWKGLICCLYIAILTQVRRMFKVPKMLEKKLPDTTVELQPDLVSNKSEHMQLWFRITKIKVLLKRLKSIKFLQLQIYFLVCLSHPWNQFLSRVIELLALERNVFEKFFPIDNFPLKIKKVEFLDNLGKIVKFILIIVDNEVVGFEIVLGSYTTFYIYDWM